MLRLVGIGALGNMLSPAASHLSKENSVGRFLRIYDRNPNNPNRQQRREKWLTHGATLVNTYENLFKNIDIDGVVICAGKNGDDLQILSQVIPLICHYFPTGKRPFILHCSTVSVEFVQAAFKACEKMSIQYANYPLTGGVKGAEAGTMLILASGQKKLFERLCPVLNYLGKPQYFDSDVAAAAKVKLIGHLLVFNGILGISTGIALQKKSLHLAEQSTTDFFDFLNQGSGGTRQWDVALRQGVNQEIWDSGFLLPHAAIDAIYTADLLIKYHLPIFCIIPILQLAASFSFLMQQSTQPLATQVLLKGILEMPKDLTDYINGCQDVDPKKYLDNVIKILPPTFQEKVKLDIEVADFMDGFNLFSSSQKNL